MIFLVKRKHIKKKKIVKFSDGVYKDLYVDLKRQFNYYLRNKRHHAQKCKECINDYNEAVVKIRTIKDDSLREDLLEMLSILWDNNCIDFDIINHSLRGYYGRSSYKK